jgi:catechol 2,3-dioxygenase-like lactoylglutathione lyase family enzyme
MKRIGVIHFDKVVLDCQDPAALSDFYAALLGWSKGYVTDDFIIIGSEDSNADIGFQRDDDYSPPVWPAGKEKQQQMLHIDFSVEKAKLQEWIDYAVGLGAKKADLQYAEEGEWVVMLDPEGHPFCFDAI